ncbi:hypothetical protein E4U40_007465 [Claviceps sp. LM458 group G5]|nr:hypothetical protein E4U40_007465 [Claviceps sp. LM458 group G5]
MTGTGDLYHLHDALVAMIAKKERDYKQEAARQEAKQRREYIGQLWLGQLTTTITYKAIDLLAKQHRIAMAALPSSNREVVPLEPCSHRFTQVYGLPCSHVIFQRLAAEEPLRVDDVHPRWLLRKPLHVDEPLLLINDPDIVQTNRGELPQTIHLSQISRLLCHHSFRLLNLRRRHELGNGGPVSPVEIVAAARVLYVPFELDDLASEASEASQSREQSSGIVRGNPNKRARGSTRGRGGRASAM